MMGGSEIMVSGPCFPDVTDRLKCRFADVVTDGVALDNVMKAACVQPITKALGHVPLGVSIDGGNNYFFEKDYLLGNYGFQKCR